MFAGTYFTPAYYARSYFPGGAAVEAPPDESPAPAMRPGRASRRPVAEVLLQQLTPPVPVHYAYAGRVTIALGYTVGATVEAAFASVAFAFEGATGVRLGYRARSAAAHRQRWVEEPGNRHWVRLRTRDARRRREEAELLGISGGGLWDG